MSFEARVFRLLIASPSDVSDEREIAVSAIQAWNDQNSVDRQVVILPLRWETHATPEYGKRPQEAINRQIVDGCDLLVGIFWARIGTPSGVADSGTLEEIERVASQGKPVMLYFSKARQDPDLIDTTQLEKLRDFKKKTFPNALVEHFVSQIDFRDKLSKQIDTQIRAMIAEQNQPENTVAAERPGTRIELGFCDPETGEVVGPTLQARTTIVAVTGADKLPDFQGRSGNALSGIVTLDRENPNYYREMAEFLARRSGFVPIRLWLRNAGGLGARDLFVDIRIKSNDSEISVEPMTRLNPPVRSRSSFYGSFGQDNAPAIAKVGDDWTINLELAALQPKRTIKLDPMALVVAASSGVVNFEVRIFADTLSEPILETLQLRLDVMQVTNTARRLLKDGGVRLPQSRSQEGSKTRRPRKPRKVTNG